MSDFFTEEDFQKAARPDGYINILMARDIANAKLEKALGPTENAKKNYRRPADV